MIVDNPASIETTIASVDKSVLTENPIQPNNTVAIDPIKLLISIHIILCLNSWLCKQPTYNQNQLPN